MAVGPFSLQIQERRVELVQNCSRHVTRLLELLFQMGALTEEDQSLIRGNGCTGERDCMRTLLDVLYSRGEESCRAFFNLLIRVQPETCPGTSQPNIQLHLQTHKRILARQHCPIDYLNIRQQSSAGVELSSFTDITFSRQVGHAVPMKYQHETACVGDAFRCQSEETCRQGEATTFKGVCQALLSIPGNGVTLLSGVAGSGKTTVVRWLVQQWAADLLCQKMVFSLSFRELNLISDPQSLLELLSVHYNHLKPVLSEIITLNPACVLLILDGLDEFCFPLDFDHTPKCSDPERVQNMGAMVVNLMKGNLLPGISILMTSRPHAVSKIPPQLVSRVYSVLGFSPEQQQQYFKQTCSSAQEAASVWAFVSSHRPLLLMCHIPAFCWIVATALHNGFLDKGFKTPSAGLTERIPAANSGNQAGRDHVEPPQLDVETTNGPVALNAARPFTVTEIYCSFLKSILVFHVEGRATGSHLNRLQEAPQILQEAQPVLLRLGALAFKGLLERRFLFDCSDLGSLATDSNKFSQAILVEILKEDRASLTCKRSFYFIHTSVQEFLSALYYVLQSLSGSDPFSGLKPTMGSLPRSVRACLASVLCKLRGPSHLLRRYVKAVLHKSAHHQSGHMDLFCRFVSGLLVPQTQHILDGLFPGGPRKAQPRSAPLPFPPVPPFLLRLLHSQLEGSSLSAERQVNTYHCLYEAQDPELSQRLQGWLGVLAQGELSPFGAEKRDWSELAFLLQLKSDLQVLKLDGQGLDAEGLRRLLPVLPVFTTLSLGQNPIGPEGAAVLSLALRSPDCHIERLWVVRTGLGGEGLRILTEALKENHTVVDLRLAINEIGDVGASYLAELLRTNRTLKDLRLRDNQVTDQGADLLMAGLRDNTTLEYLWMFDNKLSKEGVQKLRDFAKTRSHLDIKVCCS